MLQAQGRYIDALADCGRAHALDPCFRRPIARMASLLEHLRKPAAAVARMHTLCALPCGDAAAMHSERKQLQRLEALVKYGIMPDHFTVLGLSAASSVRNDRLSICAC
jgi:hypothetical protein